MCKCNPIIRTPFCGAPGCEWPEAADPAIKAAALASDAKANFPPMDYLGLNSIKPQQVNANARMRASVEAIAQQRKPRGTGPEITALLVADLQARAALGEVKYGEMLRAFNGRDPLVDAYQEALDLSVYLRQELEERRRLLQFATWVFTTCEHALAEGVNGGGSKWAEGLRELSAQARKLAGWSPADTKASGL